MSTTRTTHTATGLRSAGIALLSLLLSMCTPDEPRPAEPSTPTPLNLAIPSNFPEPVYDLSTNPLTVEGVALGKRLFYDGRLSRTNLVSCGFCHIQPSAFTHHGHDLSHGVDDKLGRRNALPLQNLIFYKTFFWDGGVHNLDLVPLNAITSEVEMDETVDNILEKLRVAPNYPEQFEKAFGTDDITSTRFLQALTQFMATMISTNSKYDLYVRKENNVTLTEIELAGLALFTQKCSGCHASDLFTDLSYRNNGYSSPTDLARDKGREEVTLKESDRGKFKVPSLRNIEYSAPYMHNGKLKTLDDVLEFYVSGVHDSPTLDPLLKQGDEPGIPMTAEERSAILAFLYTLTDERYLTDRKFSEY